jgi:uncharacterized damage-inducible protein DinB
MTGPRRERPPPTADERTLVVGWLDLQRALIPWKCEGLSEADAHRGVLAPTSPLMSLAGLVSHLRWVEHCWFEVILLNRPSEENPLFGDVEDAELDVADVPLERLLAEYAAQCAVSDEIVAAHDLDAVASHATYGGTSLRWILLHMLEETARHAGHADVIRELLDGRKGYY